MDHVSENAEICIKSSGCDEVIRTMGTYREKDGKKYLFYRDENGKCRITLEEYRTDPVEHTGKMKSGTILRDAYELFVEPSERHEFMMRTEAGNLWFESEGHFITCNRENLNVEILMEYDLLQNGEICMTQTLEISVYLTGESNL